MGDTGRIPLENLDGVPAPFLLICLAVLAWLILRGNRRP